MTASQQTTVLPTHEELLRRVDPLAVQVRQSKIHNLGVFAMKNIPKGTFIIEYEGPKMEGATIFEKLSKEQRRYVFHLDKHWSIDGSSPTNRAGRINHSCDGNCYIEFVDGHIWVVALKDISVGEELGYNYGYRLSSLTDMEKNWRCHCGARNCIGFILRSKDWPKLKRKLEERDLKKMMKRAERKAYHTPSGGLLDDAIMSEWTPLAVQATQSSVHLAELRIQ